MVAEKRLESGVLASPPRPQPNVTHKPGPLTAARRLEFPPYVQNLRPSRECTPKHNATPSHGLSKFLDGLSGGRSSSQAQQSYGSPLLAS
ncbi:hypothetical protein E2C01_081256 [Portunus trituberculatus]|uniref:Uncharacterized protein n=1 Tax=Portunus trituberculatus TaxID=210409 RepID=A0A5B7IW57_PORTR|nr:hypothetical protein [Portunus trituberculatus]